MDNSFTEKFIISPMTAPAADDDVKLMLAFKEGDEEAFGALLARHETPLINFIYRFTGNRDDAEDIAQEVFLRIYRSRERYEPKAKFSTWMYRIAANLCLDHKKKMRRDPLGRARPQHSSGEGEEENEIRDPSEKPLEAVVEQQHADERIRRTLSLLPENQRLALTLKVYEDRSYEEIAEILSCSVSAVESLLFRARQTMKARVLPSTKNMVQKGGSAS